MGAARTYAEIVTTQALAALIGTHYRPTGHDAATTFGNLTRWIERLELQEAVRTLSVVHVAGTKGKGSTCAFAESILRSSGHRTGLFTSPHLVDIRERIQIDGRPVSEEVFATHFWWCHDRLQATAELSAPPYFYFLTLLALRVFHAERVDVAVLEVGLGGRWDATNVVPAPAVCGITSLGYDHMDILGHTLTLIAGEKAGIIKAGVPAVTTTQPEEARVVLEQRAQELQVSLLTAPPLEAFSAPRGVPLQLGLAGAHQRLNAALAVQLCRIWATRARPLCPKTAAQEETLLRGELPESFAAGLAHTHWPGRAQVVRDAAAAASDESGAATASSNLTFYLDGAHTGESAATCADWFVDAATTDAAQQPSSRVLVFNCMKEREPKRLLQPLVSVMAKNGIVFHHAIFVPVEVLGPQSAAATDLSWQSTLKHTWDELQPGMGAHALAAARAARATPPASQCVLPASAAAAMLARPSAASAVMPSTAATLTWLRRHARESRAARVQVLVTGSLYLVGDFLRLLKPRATK